ncbi:MAG: hypothetical protein HUJ74_00060 [Lachnospiraceae bacterium]|nr:hypothetical protein [Lachnospiraceae bacterium]
MNKIDELVRYGKLKKVEVGYLLEEFHPFLRKKRSSAKKCNKLSELYP